MSIVKRIPQLAVSAKFLCFLMVAICSAAPGKVHSVRLHNDCSSSELRVNYKGEVYSNESHGFNEMRLESVGFGKLTIFAEQSARFVCFNKRWKLVGAKKMHGKRCQWQEVMEKGFNRYRSLANPAFSLALNPNGRPMPGPKTVAGPGRHGKRAERCAHFVKQGRDLAADIHAHNIGGQLFRPPKRPHRPHAAPS